MLGLKSSARPPDAEHPLGHGRAMYFWSFIVALCCSAWIAMVEAIISCERALRAAFPQVRWLFFEPDVRK